MYYLQWQIPKVLRRIIMKELFYLYIIMTYIQNRVCGCMMVEGRDCYLHLPYVLFYNFIGIQTYTTVVLEYSRPLYPSGLCIYWIRLLYLGRPVTDERATHKIICSTRGNKSLWIKREKVYWFSDDESDELCKSV